MPSLEETLAEANSQIGVFLEQERPAITPLCETLARVAPFLPCAHPTLRQRAALAEYRQNLEALQEGIGRLTGRLWSDRTSVRAKLQNLKVARTYQQSANL
jgi:hypothetical protein